MDAKRAAEIVTGVQIADRMKAMGLGLLLLLSGCLALIACIFRPEIREVLVVQSIVLLATLYYVYFFSVIFTVVTGWRRPVHIAIYAIIIVLLAAPPLALAAPVGLLTLPGWLARALAVIATLCFFFSGKALITFIQGRKRLRSGSSRR